MEAWPRHRDRGQTSGRGGRLSDGLMGGVDAEMRARMQRMHGAGDDSLVAVAMLPMHRRMVANMPLRMNGEMRQAHMAAAAGWTATADSFRHDLVRMPGMRGAELAAMLPAHEVRVTRLAEMH